MHSLFGLICVVGPVAAVIAIYVVSQNKKLSSVREKDQLLRGTYEAYQNSLATLRRAPTRPDLRTDALEKGRQLAQLERLHFHGQNIAVFDEVALKNDLDAACAGAGAPSIPSVTAQPTVAARLEELKALLDRDLITQAEFDARREGILNDL
jgi:hypothetical protein